MNIEILQYGLITAYGNAYIKERNISFDKNHPMSNSIQNIKFVRKSSELEPLSKSDLIAKNPNEWFKFLKENKFSRLYLTYQLSTITKLKEHISEAFTGGGSQWIILAEKEEFYDLWNILNRTEEGDNITYYLLALENSDLGVLKFPSLETSKLYLKEILTDLIKFTVKSELPKWSDTFQKAIDYLSNENLEELIDDNILPSDCYSLETRQVLSACDKAWVFGGIGSWNDVVKVYDYNLYNRLTANLYDSVCKAFVSAINSYP